MRKIAALALLSILILAACSPAPSAGTPAAGAPASSPTAAGKPAGATEPAGPADLSRTDEQGAVTVVVTPLNLDNPGATLDFDVSMNTHSVDLSMDLATLATLSADNGRSVKATQWDAPSGGHHVQGTLSFPAQAAGGALLDGARQLTLTVKNVAADERVFTWQLGE